MNAKSKKCFRCGAEVPASEISATGKCRICERTDEDERARALKSSINLAMGDMLGTGIPGGFDGNFSTPI